MATLFRSPVVVKIPKRPSLPSDVYAAPRALYAPNPTRPFIQSDWPSAVRARAPLKSDYTVNLLALLQPNPAQPFIQADWPSLRPSMPPQKSDAPANMRVLLSPNPAAPFVELEWRYPADPRKAALVDAVVNLAPIQTPVVVEAPFSQSAWPNAAARQKELKSDAPADMLALLQPNPSAPFSEAAWNLAAKQPRLVQVDTVVNLVPLQNPPVVGDPFVQLDWLLPTRSRMPILVDGNTDNFLPILFPDVTPVPTPVGKPVKIRRRYVRHWNNLARNARGRYEEIPQFYEIVAKAAKDEGKPASEALAQVSDQVIEVIRPFARSTAEIPGIASIDWRALQANLDAYNRLMALYAYALMIEQGDEEDLLLAAMLAW